MEIPQDKAWLAKYRWSLIFIGAVLVFTSILFSVSGAFLFTTSPPENLTVVRVTEGTFEKVVSAYGQLKPKQQRTLVSQSSGTVIEILKRPGESVSADSIVLVLSNPEIVSAVRQAKLDLQRAEAELAVLKADLLDQKLTMENDRLMLQAEISTKKAELEALEALAKQSIVSALDLKKMRMKLHQFELQLALAQEKEERAESTSKARLASGHLAVEQAKYILAMQEDKHRALNVRAGLKGVLQSQQSTLALGQWLSQGEMLGVVSGTENLFAELNVNASDASSVLLGMNAKLDIRGRSSVGKVIRVAPNANQNQVQVDVDIIEPLPDIARANLDIRGDIVVFREEISHLLPRPSHYRVGQPLQLYVKQPTGNFSLEDIPVLESSDDQLAIAKSFAIGTEVLLNNPARWNQQPIITLDE